MLLAVAVDVEDAVYAAVAAQADAGGHRMRTDFRAVPDGVGNMSNQGAGFGAHFASLQAEPAIDAVGAISMGSGENCDRTSGHRADAEPRTTAHQHVAHAS